MKSILLSFPVLIVLSAMLYVRLTPQDIAELHMRLEFSMDETQTGRVKRRIEGDIKGLHKVISQESQTRIAAGDPKEGHVTYVTRSLFWGFPDYTTVQREGGDLLIHARSVFGRSDLGVNAARVDRWINALTSNVVIGI